MLKFPALDYKKKSWLLYGAAAAGFLLLALVSAFWDLEINKFLYNGDSLFGQFMANVGEFPSYIAVPVACVILFYNRPKKTRGMDIGLGILYTALIGLGYYYCLSWLITDGKFASDGLMYIAVYRIFFAGILTWLSLLFGSKVDNDLMRKLFWFAIFLLIVMAVSNIAVQIMKAVWNRQRFRSLDLNTFEGFTPWYQPVIGRDTDAALAGISPNSYHPNDSDAFRSFPSGHTVAAGASFALILIPDIFKNMKKYKWIFWAAPAVYTVLMGISRIIVGAHYLSDVTFGGYIAFLTAVLFRKLIIKKAKSIRGAVLEMRLHN